MFCLECLQCIHKCVEVWLFVWTQPPYLTCTQSHEWHSTTHPHACVDMCKNSFKYTTVYNPYDVDILLHYAQETQTASDRLLSSFFVNYTLQQLTKELNLFLSIILHQLDHPGVGLFFGVVSILPAPASFNWASIGLYFHVRRWKVWNTFLPAKVTLRFLCNNEPLLSSPLPSSHPLFCEWKCSHSAKIIKYEMLEVYRRQTLSGVWGRIDQMQVTTHQNVVIFKAFQGICIPLWLYITNS